METSRKSIMIRIGDFFFKYRNKAFPLIVVMLFALALPPTELFGRKDLEITKDIVALAVAVLGLIVRSWVIGYVYIKRGGLNKQVYADTLVVSGIFGLCRNPLYVGNILICVGFFLMHGNPYIIAIGISLYLFIYQCIVLAEEYFLINKFGAEYHAYTAGVPRWGFKFSNFKKSTEDMAFDFKRSIMKDYTTIGTTLIVLTLTEMYEYLGQPEPWTNHSSYLSALFCVLVICGVWVGTIKYIKKGHGIKIV